MQYKLKMKAAVNAWVSANLVSIRTHLSLGKPVKIRSGRWLVSLKAEASRRKPVGYVFLDDELNVVSATKLKTH